MSAGRTAVVITKYITMYERLISEEGITVVGAAESAVAGVQLIKHFQPDYVVADLNLRGEADLSFVEEIKHHTTSGRVLLVSDDVVTTSTTSTLGVAQIVARADIPSLGQRLVALEDVIDLTTADGQVERRQRDRRVRQDWSKVGWERRVSVRRQADVDAMSTQVSH